jgi:ATP/maltotriose-dependent transcriptional regulator MalT
MNIIKILLYLVVIGFASSSPIAYAADNPSEIKAALEQTVAKLEAAVAALGKGEDGKKIADMIVEARQLQKGISTSDSKVSMKRSQSNHKLVLARTSINEGDLKAGGELLKEALAGYKEVQEKFNAAH